jgi:hypothetical protein
MEGVLAEMQSITTSQRCCAALCWRYMRRAVKVRCGEMMAGSHLERGGCLRPRVSTAELGSHRRRPVLYTSK